MRVVRLIGRHDRETRAQLPGRPQRLEIGHRSAAAQMAQMRFPTEEACDRGNRFPLHRGARAAAVEGVIVGIDPHREGIGEPGDGVRGLQHLTGVERMKVGVVVLQATGDLQEHFLRRRAFRRRRGRRQKRETRLEAVERRGQSAQILPERSRGRRGPPGVARPTRLGQRQTSANSRAKLPPRIFVTRSSEYPRASSIPAIVSRRRGVFRSGTKV